MPERARTVTWRGEQFRFELLENRGNRARVSPMWAVTRRREFIGTMSRAAGETTKEFEVRSVLWLDALLG